MSRASHQKLIIETKRRTRQLKITGVVEKAVKDSGCESGVF
jgi:thiamine phosphate synthase YjbQ (UPF0047 family)